MYFPKEKSLLEPVLKASEDERGFPQSCFWSHSLEQVLSLHSNPLELSRDEPVFIVSWVIKWNNALKNSARIADSLKFMSKVPHTLQYNYIILHFKVLVKRRRYSNMWAKKFWTFLNDSVSLLWPHWWRVSISCCHQWWDHEAPWTVFGVSIAYVKCIS